MLTASRNSEPEEVETAVDVRVSHEPNDKSPEANGKDDEEKLMDEGGDNEQTVIIIKPDSIEDADETPKDDKESVEAEETPKGDKESEAKTVESEETGLKTGVQPHELLRKCINYLLS